MRAVILKPLQAFRFERTTGVLVPSHRFSVGDEVTVYTSVRMRWEKEDRLALKLRRGTLIFYILLEEVSTRATELGTRWLNLEERRGGKMTEMTREIRSKERDAVRTQLMQEAAECFRPLI